MSKKVGKFRDADVNPCIEETNASQQCMNYYNYDKNMCARDFLKYKKCRQYWHNIMLTRRREGVRPDMPTAAERQEMLAGLGGKPY